MQPMFSGMQPTPMELMPRMPPMGAAGAAGAMLSGFGNNPLKGHKGLKWTVPYLIYANLPAHLLPWSLFSLLFLSVALFDDASLGVCASLLAIVISGATVMLSQGLKWRVLAIACVAATIAGTLVAAQDRVRFSQVIQIYDTGRWYTNVIPSEHPDSKRDAGLITFSVDSRVDTTMGVGYVDGDRWCAAPVLGRATTDFVGYWAVGVNCCGERGRFKCGDVRNPNAHSSMVVVNEDEIAKYMVAARMSASAFGFQLPEPPVFLRWTSDAPGYMAGLVTNRTQAVLGLVVGLLGISVVCAVFLPALGKTFVDERNDFPEPSVSRYMQMGCDGHSCFLASGDAYLDDDERQFQRSLLHHRCYYSGECLHDYIFYICNEHMFVGVLACHPAHPYNKTERFLVALVVSLLVVYPVSVLSINLGDGLPRLIAIALLVTVPRTILKQYLKKVTVQDAEEDIQRMSLDHCAEDHAQSLRRANPKFKEVIYSFIVIYACTFVVCAISHWEIVRYGRDPLTTLFQNSDGIAFGFVLEPLLGLIMPQQIQTQHGKPWVFGFFHNWITTRDEGWVMPGMSQGADGEKRRARERKMGYREAAKELTKQLTEQAPLRPAPYAQTRMPFGDVHGPSSYQSV